MSSRSYVVDLKNVSRRDWEKAGGKLLTSVSLSAWASLFPTAS